MTQLIKILAIVLIAWGVISCTQKPEYPPELKFCFEYLNENWDPKEIEIFRNISKENSEPRDYHFGIGLHLRNYLIRNHPYSDSIQSYFHRNGVEHYDHMSSIILNSYYKYLHNEKLELEEYYADMKIYQRKRQACHARLDSLSQVYDRDYLLEDTASILVPIRDSIHIVYADCYDWEFDYENDLKLVGVIVQKEYTGDNSLFSFDIKLLDRSKPDIDIYEQAYHTGDTLRVRTNTSWKLIDNHNLLPISPNRH